MKHILILIAAVVLAGTSAHASFECYLKIQAIPGESTAEGHTNEMAVQSFAFELSHPGGAAVQVSEVVVAKLVDKASPLLALRCADGTFFPEAIITCRSSDPGRPIFYRVRLYDLIVSRVAVSADAVNQNRPGESIGLRFNRMRWEYITSQGVSVLHGWDFAAQRPY